MNKCLFCNSNANLKMNLVNGMKTVSICDDCLRDYPKPICSFCKSKQAKFKTFYVDVKVCDDCYQKMIKCVQCGWRLEEKHIRNNNLCPICYEAYDDNK